MRYLYLSGFIGLFIVTVFVIERILRAADSAYSLWDTSGTGQIAKYVLVLLFIAAFIRFAVGANLADYFRLYFKQPRKAVRGFLVMLAFTLLAVAVGYLVLGVLGEAAWSDASQRNLSLKRLIETTGSLTVVLVLATTEELVFRAFVLGYLRWNATRAVTVAAVLASALIFAITHRLDDPFSWFTPEQFPLLVGLFVLGVLLGTAYVSTGSLTCSIAIHAGLLGSKVFLRKTHLLAIDFEPWWMGPGGDLRMAPAVWLLFLLMAVGAWWIGRRYHASLAMEPSPEQGWQAQRSERTAHV